MSTNSALAVRRTPDGTARPLELTGLIAAAGRRARGGLGAAATLLAGVSSPSGGQTSPDTMEADDRLAFERGRLRLRLGLLVVPLLALGAHGAAAVEPALASAVAALGSYALLRAALHYRPRTVLRFQLWVRLLDVALLYMVLFGVHRFVGQPLFEAFYVFSVVAATATHGSRGARLVAAACTVAAVLGRVHLAHAGVIAFDAPQLAGALAYGVFFFYAAGTVASIVRTTARGARARLAAVLDATPDCVVLLDGDGRCEYVNPAGKRLLGMDESDGSEQRRAGGAQGAAPAHLTDFMPEWARAQFQGAALPFAAASGVWSGELGMRRADGTEVPVSQVVVAHRSAGGDVEYYGSIARDISDRHAAEEALQRLALYDSLTKLPNRTLLSDRLEQALRAARRVGGSVALLLVDLDRFKEVNDSLGHAAGDALLTQVATRFKDVLRESDTIARLGGDEFAVLLPSVAGLGQVEAAAQKLHSALASPVVVEGRELHVEASIGGALYPIHGADAETLVRHADVAMYEAKRSGSGDSAFAVYTAENDPYGPDRLALVADLRHAIEQGEIALHYQPKVSPDGRVGGVEALARWNHPERGWVAPSEFVPLAESMNLIRPLTRCVLHEAIAQCRAWLGAGLRLRVSVNLSMADVHDATLADAVHEALRVHAVSPELLRLEITETAVMSDPRRSKETLERLRAMGVEIAIDDFGTGYSSLAYLKQLPVCVLKIDRSFVSDMMASESGTAIVRATIDLGHTLGMSVVAEGVEDEACWRALEGMGCDHGQGYLFSPALPAAELQRWLASREAPPV